MVNLINFLLKVGEKSRRKRIYGKLPYLRYSKPISLLELF